MDYITSDIRSYFKRIIAASIFGLKLGLLLAIVITIILLKMTNTTVIKKRPSPAKEFEQSSLKYAPPLTTLKVNAPTHQKEQSPFLEHRLQIYPENLERYLSKAQKRRLDTLRSSFLSNNRDLSPEYILNMSKGDKKVLVAFAQWLKKSKW